MNSLILILILITAISLGVPVAIAMALSSLAIFVIGNYPFHILPQLIIENASSWVLLAVPFFIIAGSFMNEFGVTERLFRFALVTVGHIRGGMGHVNVLCSMIFAGISGSSVADIGGLGKVELKAMDDAGYNKKVSVGITVASSIIGPIIPPSIAFILYGVIAQVSIARLFFAGIVPGVVIGINLMLTTYILTFKKPEYFPKERRKFSIQEVPNAFKGALSVIMAPLLVLLGMTSGYISPTEAGAGAVLYTIFVGIFYRTIRLTKAWEVVKSSMIQAANAMLLMSIAGVMGFIITFERTPQFVAGILISFTGGNVWLIMLISILLFLIIGCFMSATAALIILAPIFVPIITQLGIDPIQFGVIICYTLQIGIATPPVGIGLYVVSDIADMELGETIHGVSFYWFSLIINAFLITYIPQLSLWLPNLIFN